LNKKKRHNTVLTEREKKGKMGKNQKKRGPRETGRQKMDTLNLRGKEKGEVSDRRPEGGGAWAQWGRKAA